ncbi:hypothetical protein ACUOE1_003472 [Vibrio cholerae]
MNFPGVILYNDRSYKVINSKENLLKDYMWAQAQYMVNDVFIDNQGNQFRLCPRDENEEVTDMIADEVVHDMISANSPYKEQELIEILRDSGNEVVKRIVNNLSSRREI